MKPFLLSENNLRSITDTEFDLALLPWGATEAHNLHLPYGTDNYETGAFAEKAAAMAWEQGTKCLVLPAIPYGVNTGQQDIPGTINLYPSTQSVILHDILESVSNAGIRKFLILNGHGGNDFRQMLREAGRDHPELFLASANWFQAVDKTRYFELAGDHADEMETSLMLYLRSDLVQPLEQAGDGRHRSFRAASLNENWAWSERMWTRVTRDTGIGNPEKANAVKGEDYYNAVCEKLAGLISELGRMKVDDAYV
ncbi:MAG: creatininase family protein [Bacteroidales bacterium]|nr:creatininase family protein [Bacteroidales bacterium]MDT8431466.1 creatininase family protein [Bacteroidales bacterium]